MCGQFGQPRPEHVQLVIQDVLTLHGRQFKDAALIVASPPCQAYSYRAMPWKRAKALPPPDNTLFDACFRIQREASEAAGRRVPMVVENVRGAQPWVGRARWMYGSFALWGDVPALMPIAISAVKVPGMGAGWRPPGHPDHKPGLAFNPAAQGRAVREGRLHRSDDNGRKIGGDWFSDPQSTCRRHGSKSKGRKMASAMIAKIPLPLSRWIAATYRPAAQVAA
jgi:hypothetical protein